MKKITKKLLCCLLPFALFILACIPSFAALEYVTSEITGTFDILPPEYTGAKTVALADFFEEGATKPVWEAQREPLMTRRKQTISIMYI